jgi:NADH:ubiquinone oxidoreductase subunit H
MAYLTILERKIVKIFLQFRKGPNKVEFLGLLQPFGDACLKLLRKEGGEVSNIARTRESLHSSLRSSHIAGAP